MKRWINLAGSALAILVMGGVLYAYGGDLREVDFTDAALLSGLAGAILLYIVVVVFGALSWRILLTAFGWRPASWAAERQVLISQMGKYVPGNVAQYLGRAAMTIAAGVPARTVGLAIMTETAVMLTSGFLAVLLSSLLFPGLFRELRQLVPDPSALIWIGAGLAVFFSLLLGATLASGWSKRFENLPKIRLSGLILAIGVSTASFLVLGFSLQLLVAALTAASVPVSLSVSVFAAAWIVGLATPGAPGGLGIREAVLTLGLAPFMGGASALAAALLYRGVSVIGDVAAFGLGLLLPKAELTDAKGPSEGILR